jgi:hypothetical protein
VRVRAQNNREGLRHSQEALSDFEGTETDANFEKVCATEADANFEEVRTEADANFEEVRALLEEHLRVVTSSGYKGSDNARCPKTAAECRS